MTPVAPPVHHVHVDVYAHGQGREVEVEQHKRDPRLAHACDVLPGTVGFTVRRHRDAGDVRASASASTDQPRFGRPPDTSPSINQKLSINCCTAEELVADPSLWGIYPSLAKSMIHERVRGGAYFSVEDVRNRVYGFGSKRQNAMRRKVSFSPNPLPRYGRHRRG